MKILFTGGSSFTGHWFVRELAAAGHEIVMILRRDLDRYTGVRRSRVEQLPRLGRVIQECSFGDDRFTELIRKESWDLLCHHAAEVSDYQNRDFDVCAAVASNTNGTNRTLRALVASGCQRILVTGSVFEPGEGAGSDGLPAFSPYGLSKALTAQVLGYYATLYEMQVGKFVISNPFGPYEEHRLTSYLAQSWFEGEKAIVKTPAYVRDNIHVSLLAKAYADFAERLPSQPGMHKLNPSGYVESQGAFVSRFADNLRDRLQLDCRFELGQQHEFPEPKIRINTDPLDVNHLGWVESQAWDDLAKCYQQIFAKNAAT